MKRFLVLLCAVCLLVTLCSCAAESKDVDLSAFYQQITETYELPQMTEVTDELLDAYFPGLSSADMTQRVMYVPLMNVTATEILLVQAADAEAADVVEDAFNDRLIQLDQQWKLYLPDQYELVQAASVYRQGLYVALIVSEYQDDILSELQSALS